MMSSAGTLRVQDVGLLNLIARRVWSPDRKSAITFRKQGGTGLKYQVFVWSCSWHVNLYLILTGAPLRHCIALLESDYMGYGAGN